MEIDIYLFQEVCLKTIYERSYLYGNPIFWKFVLGLSCLFLQTIPENIG